MSTPKPARQTGRIRAASRRGVTGWEVTSVRLPTQLVDSVPAELREEHRKRRQHD
jgi:hypothetical protein